jgi:hypothetical protein
LNEHSRRSDAKPRITKDEALDRAALAWIAADRLLPEPIDSEEIVARSHRREDMQR